jgi:hypothetical protein
LLDAAAGSSICLPLARRWWHDDAATALAFSAGTYRPIRLFLLAPAMLAPFAGRALLPGRGVVGIGQTEQDKHPAKGGRHGSAPGARGTDDAGQGIEAIFVHGPSPSPSGAHMRGET